MELNVKKCPHGPIRHSYSEGAALGIDFGEPYPRCALDFIGLKDVTFV
jgi:FMN-dependent NADH-azoreductase